MGAPKRSWWQTGVVYQIYPRSFADSNADGIGDLPGILEHLDHLEWLGVDGIWLSPVTVSPNADYGYDVADYCDVDPAYGDLATLDALIEAARQKGIAVLMDLVPNHTSDQHRWFLDARRGREARYRDFYVWADPKADGSPPNNWISTFGGPAWTLDEASGQYYLHNFLPEQPDLNWWNEEVRQAFDDILDFWFARGIAGFRIDVCSMVVKDRDLRDNPPSTDSDSFLERIYGQRWLYNATRPEVHEVIRRWRARAEAATPPRLLLGETNVNDLETLASFYGTASDELQMGFNFAFLEAPLEASALGQVVAQTERLLGEDNWPVWTGSNHDVSRLATRWAEGNPARVRLALMLLLTLRGTPVLYQGDEIGLEDGPIERRDVLDPVGERFWPAYPGRDPERTPVPWTPEGGFGATGVVPWLPLVDPAANNVADQRADPGSILHFTRDLIALRRATPALTEGARTPLASDKAVLAYRREPGVTVALNLGDAPALQEGLAGRVAAATHAARLGEVLEGPVTLDPYEGVVVIADREN
jgi:alpha-glucosidase